MFDEKEAETSEDGLEIFFWSPDVDLSGFQTVRYGESRLFS